MNDSPTYSERSALADARTSASTLVLTGVVTVRALAVSAGWFAFTLLAIAAGCAVFALWAASSHYHWREDPEHRNPRPWVAFLAAISVGLSCIAGLSLSVTDVGGALVDVTP